MKVKCPNCEAVYNIDISKIPVIPEGGITTTCPKCKGKIPITLDTEPEKKKPKEQIFTCPECGHVNISTYTCAGCGKVFSKEELGNMFISLH